MVRNEVGDTDWERLLLLLPLSAPPGVWVSMLRVLLLRCTNGGGARCPSGISWGCQKLKESDSCSWLGSSFFKPNNGEGLLGLHKNIWGRKFYSLHERCQVRKLKTTVFKMSHQHRTAEAGKNCLGLSSLTSLFKQTQVRIVCSGLCQVFNISTDNESTTSPGSAHSHTFKKTQPKP